MKKILTLTLAIIMCAISILAFASCKQSEKVITVGYTLVEPLNYLNDKNELVGFDTELAQKVFGNLGYKVIFKEIKWENKYNELASGSIDCIWNGFTANCADDDGVERSSKVDFSYNYMENRQVIVTKKSEVEKITSLDALKDKIGYVEVNSAGATYAEGITGAIIKESTKQTDAIMQVKAGSAYFAIVDAQLARSMAGKGDYSDLALVEAISSDVEYYAIGFKKGSDLTANVNEQLDKLAKDGTIADLAKKYGVENTTITDFSDQKK